MLKIGVLGVGHLGKIHLKCIRLSDRYDLVGFYDPDPETARRVSEEFQVRAFPSLEELFSQVDVIDIVTPTTTHYALASRAIAAGKHLFIEKPLTQTVEEGRMLLEEARSKGVKVQVGHVERFNPVFLAMGKNGLKPLFIEGHRLAVFNPRGTDVSVVLDLMIHDLDLVLSLVKSPVKAIHADGVSVVSHTPDICTARIEFENGCVANLTSSRLAMKAMRKMRVFQRDAYISLDFLNKDAQVIQLRDQQDAEETLMELDTAKGRKFLAVSSPPVEEVNAIRAELESFAEAILQDTRPVVSMEDAFDALEVAIRIEEQVREKEARLDQMTS